MGRQIVHNHTYKCQNLNSKFKLLQLECYKSYWVSPTSKMCSLPQWKCQEGIILLPIWEVTSFHFNFPSLLRHIFSRLMPPSAHTYSLSYEQSTQLKEEGEEMRQVCLPAVQMSFLLSLWQSCMWTWLLMLKIKSVYIFKRKKMVQSSPSWCLSIWLIYVSSFVKIKLQCWKRWHTVRRDDTSLTAICKTPLEKPK